MELAVYFAQIEHVLDLEEALRPVEIERLPGFLWTAMFDDMNAVEYSTHAMTVKWLESVYEQGGELSRLYFGQEFCEHLIPPPEDALKAAFAARQLGWGFTYVTGSVTDAGLQRTTANLKILDQNGLSCEVVVNDWGVLRCLRRQFPDFTPTIGRLLLRQQRLARFSDISSRPVNTREIQTSESAIRTNQRSVLRSTNVSNAAYRKRIIDAGVQRLDLDIVPQGIDLPEDKWGFEVSCYYPWTYVTGGRNCLTAALHDPVRQHVVVDGPCSRPCRQINRTLNESTEPSIVQRGNTVFVVNQDYAIPYLDGTIPIDRIVLEPYLPV